MENITSSNPDEILGLLKQSKKIAVIGSPGAGKSTLARVLQEKLGYPLYYMDCLFWNADGTHVTQEELNLRVKETVSKDTWIIDGNFLRTLPIRFAACDLVVFINCSLKECLSGIESRIGTKRVDLPWVEQTLDPEFVEYVKDFHVSQLPQLEQLLEQYPQVKVLRLNNREESNVLIKYLQS